MLKRLAMLGIVYLAILPPVSPQNRSGDRKSKSQDNPPSAITIEDNSSRQTQADAPAQKPPEAHTVIEWANWALVLVGAITFGAVCIQANESRKATRAMRDALALQEKAMRQWIELHNWRSQLVKLPSIFGLLIFGMACGAWPQVPNNRSGHENQTKTGDGKAPSPSPPCVCNVQVQLTSQKDTPKPEEKPSQYPWRELYAPANMPNWFLVGVGLLAGWLALRTLRAIERQTRYTRRSAETFINKERSRLFVRGEISEDFLAGFYAENKGPSPAKVTYGFAGCEILDPNGSLPEVPDYTAGDEPWVFARTDWILPDRECRIGNYDAGYIDPDSNPELFQRVMSRKAKVWFYGVVRYRDSVSDRGHEVRFCYEMLAHDDGRLSLLPNGPDTYRREK